jgi:hypothetical protein
MKSSLLHGEISSMLVKPFTAEEEVQYRNLQRKYFKAWRDQKRQRRYSPRLTRRKDKGQNETEEKRQQEESTNQARA